VQIELESRHDSEVAAAAAQSPEQFLVGVDQAAVSGHHLRRAKVVAGQAELALQPPDATAQGQTGHTG
jgi:hypothetical protein